jgi:5-methylthioadenosine/S-adenosylhomocysteine deaminase
MTTLLQHGYLVTVDPARRVIPDGWILIDGDSIAGIGAHGTDPEPPSEERIDLGGKLAMPGLINGHNHHWGSLFKNTGEGLLLEEWLDQITLPLMAQLSPEDLRIAAYLGAIEQLRTGTTCSLNHLVNTNDAETMEAIAAPVVDIGIRQVIGKELRDTPDPAFSTRYPAHPHVRSRREEIALAEELIDRWDGAGGVVHMGLVVETGANWMLHNSTSDQIILEGVALAQRRNLKISNHCSAGTPWLSIKEFAEVTGGGDVDYLVQLGALTDNWALIHALHVTESEIAAVAGAGASFVSNPVSNAYSCDGIAPLKEMFASGVNVGLGTDGTYVNCSPDMVEQMKFAVLIQNATHYDPNLMTAERAIEMATIGSAKALGIDHLVGSLEVGKRADIAVFDLGRAHSVVGNRPVSALVFSAHGTDVDTVIVNGRIRLRGGELVGFDAEQDILAEATERAAAAIDRAGLSSRVFHHWRPSTKE